MNGAMASAQRLSFVEKFGYGLGDAATNFFFISMIYYQQRFYTDTVGLSASVVGTIFMLVRLIDAISDPIVGALADRTLTRLGKFRPWVLFTAAPFGLLFWLAYSVPDLGSTGTVVYVVVVYVLLMMAYSCNNTPYAALTGVMTAEPSERTSISSYRLFLGVVGQLVITTLALPLVEKIGGADSARGWSCTIAIFAVAIVAFNLIAFAVTRERVHPDPHQKLSFWQDLGDVSACRPWLIMFLLTLFVFITLPLRGGALNYYFSYYLDPTALATFLGNAGLGSIATEPSSWWKAVLKVLGLVLQTDRSNAAAVGFSLFNMSSTVLQICGILCSGALANRFGKKHVFTVCLGLTAVVTALLFFVPPGGVATAFLLGCLWGAFYGPTIPLLWSMMADVPDYAEWKTRRRATGFAYAGMVLALKLGLGLGGALGGWVLAAYGYHANVAQTSEALLGIRLCAAIFPGITLALGTLTLFSYPITKELSLSIRDELAERRNGYLGRTA